MNESHTLNDEGDLLLVGKGVVVGKRVSVLKTCETCGFSKFSPEISFIDVELFFFSVACVYLLSV